MDTKKKILHTSRLLFNEKGVMNVTLRNVAESLNKSYGNITYHFSTKEDVISILFTEMNHELTSLQKTNQSENLLVYFLELPSLSYDITLKYLFFTIDYFELKRNYPELFKQILLLNENRKAKWIQMLINLRKGGYLNKELSKNELEYIVFLSVSLRFTYFQMQSDNQYSMDEYILLVNSLLKPYLSSKGMTVFNNWLK